MIGIPTLLKGRTIITSAGFVETRITLFYSPDFSVIDNCRRPFNPFKPVYGESLGITLMTATHIVTPYDHEEKY
jgi:hypothetical protein